ncbi:DUF2948 family protein [Oceanibium sediminis]|uniref:DUF2948 family protein n=1 Tax=Oceanibium sediminis TaxID=2026339 RepID=UPI000DD35748|nr:DUF2948 family protein [Oceanibium sediminis]
MSDDARFEDAQEGPLRLKAERAEDVPVLAALVQDAILPSSEIRWQPKRLRFAALINRFRWEDKSAAEAEARPFERTRALLVVDSALAVRSSGVDPADKDLILSILDLIFVEGEDGGGTLRLILAGDGEIALDVECIDITLTDVTRPYAAPSGKAPHHDA